MSKQLIMSISFKQEDKWIMEAIEKGVAGKNKSKYVKELLELGLKLQQNLNPEETVNVSVQELS